VKSVQVVPESLGWMFGCQVYSSEPGCSDDKGYEPGAGVDHEGNEKKPYEDAALDG
jgi:hypothetical protein